jgi:outer membrane lipoprotein LolB
MTSRLSPIPGRGCACAVFCVRPLMGVALILGLALSGCALQPASPDGAPAVRIAATAFELEGRLSATDGERAANGRIHWQHSLSGDEWTVYSPLGQIVAHLVSTPAGAVLQTGDGRRITAPDAGSMLPEVLGVSAPVEGLPHWVQASVRSGASVLELDDRGRPSRIADQGWLIDYPEYADPDPQAPPRRLEARWGDTRIRLVIDQWTPLN